MKTFNPYFLIRVVIGLFFVVSGGEKLLSPYQNFLYVVEGYDVFPSFLEEIVARTVPWVEFFLGIFLCLGLWIRPVLAGFLVLIAGFLSIVGQALLRNLPIAECGCFGSMMSLPLHKILMLDSAMFILVIMMRISISKTQSCSLDACLK